MQSALILMFALILLATPAICQEQGGDSEDNTTSSPDSTEVAMNRWFVGTGVSILIDDIVDFKTPAIGDSTLCIDMDSRFRPTLITGALFSFDQKKRWNVLVSAKFDIGNKEQLMDGFLFGFAWRFNKNIALSVSYDLRLGRELKSRFRREAVSLVNALNQDSKYSAKFSQYQFNDKGDDLKDAEQFDGFPLRDPRDNTFLGGCCDPFIKSYNSALHIGAIFARTVDLKGLFPPE